MRFSTIVLAIQRRAVLFSVVALLVFGPWTAVALLTHRPVAYVATARVLFPMVAPADAPPTEAPAAPLAPETRVKLLSGLEVARKAVDLLKDGGGAADTQERMRKGIRYQNLTPEALHEAVTVQRDASPQIAALTARASDPETAKDYANVLPLALQNHLRDLLTQGEKEELARAEREASEGEAALKVAAQKFRRLRQGLHYPADLRAIDEQIYQTTQALQRLVNREGDLRRELDLLRHRQARTEKEPLLLRGEFPPSPKVLEFESRIAHLEAEYALLPPDSAEGRRLIDKLADFRIRLVSERRHYEANQIVRIRALDRVRAAALERETALVEGQHAETDKLLHDLADHKEEYLRRQRDVAAGEKERDRLARVLQDLKNREIGRMRFVLVEEPAVAAVAKGPPVPPWTILPVVALGLLGGVAAACAAERFNDRLRTPSDVRRYVHLPLLGSLPSEEGGPCCVARLAPRDALTEFWNRIGTVVGALADRHGARAVLVTSVAEQEGKSTVAANLAVTFSRMGRRTVLVDADLRRPSLHALFDVDNRIGLSSFLTGKLAARMLLEDIKRRIDADEQGVPEAAPPGVIEFREPVEAAAPPGGPIEFREPDGAAAPEEGAADLLPGDLRAMNGSEAEQAAAIPAAAVARAPRPADIPGMDQILKKTDIENLWIVPSGPAPTNPAGLVRSPISRNLVQYLKSAFDIVVLDSPPLSGAADALALSGAADACILVIGAGAVTRQQVRWAKTILDDVGARHLGVVLNRTTLPDRGYAYYADGQKQYREGP